MSSRILGRSGQNIKIDRLRSDGERITCVHVCLGLDQSFPSYSFPHLFKEFKWSYVILFHYFCLSNRDIRLPRKKKKDSWCSGRVPTIVLPLIVRASLHSEKDWALCPSRWRRGLIRNGLVDVQKHAFTFCGENGVKVILSVVPSPHSRRRSMLL